MNVNLFISDDLNHSPIIRFCKQSKKIIFEFKELKDYFFCKDKNNLIILRENIFLSKFLKKNKINLNNNINTQCLFLPINIESFKINVNVKIINYPIKFIDFENELLKIFSTKKNIYKYLEIKFGNTLYNLINKKQTHLTEIESKIIKLLFENKVVNKKILNAEVLHHSVIVDSKSIDSHLYRLRKKLFQVDKNVKIVSTDNQNLKII